MDKVFKIIIFTLAFNFLLPSSVSAASLAQILSGKILLDVERNGEAWYVWPENNRRYYLGRPDDAFKVMRELGLGIKNVELATVEPSDRDKDTAAKIILAMGGATTTTKTDTQKYDTAFAKRLSGKILLQVENSGEAWYVNPKDLKRYYLGRPADAFRIMRELSLGISRENLARIHKPGSAESINQYSKYEHKKIQTIDGEFTIDVIEIDLANPKLKIITDTEGPEPSHDLKGTRNFGATSLAKMAIRNNGFAAINGSYFCSSTGCGGTNYYFYPIYNTRTKKLVNEDEIKYWTTGPIIAFDANNKFYFFKDSREFKSIANFEKISSSTLQAAIGCKPRLIQDYMNYLIDWEVDEKQLNGVLTRNAIGYKDNKIYLVIAYNATLNNLANVMKALGVEYALNLDGGYSAARYYNGEYMAGPGRNIPNAIIFAEE